MIIAIIGSRSAKPEHMQKILEILPNSCSCIVSGGAKGADAIAKKIAKEKNLPFREFLPEYNIYGKTATILRNQKIVNFADQIIALWDFKSKGTQSTILYAIKCKKPCKVIPI